MRMFASINDVTLSGFSVMDAERFFSSYSEGGTVGKTGLKISALLCALVLAQGAPALPQGAAPINVGLVYSKTGPLASYGAQYAEGFAAGLDYATHGTGAVAGHKIVVTERDDTGAPDKAVAAAKDLIG